MSTPEKDFPAIMFYVTDFFGHQKVRKMNFYERALYLHVLLWCHEEPDDAISDDVVELATMAGLPLDEFNRYWPKVRERLRATPDGKLTHPRIRREKEKTIEASERNRGKANKRWQKERERKAAEAAASSTPSEKADAPKAKVATSTPSSTWGPTRDFQAEKVKRAQPKAEPKALLAVLVEAAGDKLEAPAELSEAQAKQLQQHDAADVKVLGEYIAAGQHWVQRKEGVAVLALATVLRAKLDETIAEARAWDKGGRKAKSTNATGMATPRAAVTESREVELT